jgi:hypothetical protein
MNINVPIDMPNATEAKCGALAAIVPLKKGWTKVVGGEFLPLPRKGRHRGNNTSWILQ